MFWTYILKCADESYYTGHTEDLELRIAQHQSGEWPGYTQSRLPVELVWCADFPSREQALASELRIKGWSRAKKDALIRSDWEAIERLARRQTSFETKAQPEASPSPQDERPFSPHSVRGEEAPKPQAEVPSRTTTPVAPPVIVLVRPQLGENIGKAARAMLNFGLVEMRLVAPRDGWPNPTAGPPAAGADEVLEKAEVFDTLAEAVADCAHVYATTVRKRDMTKPVFTPEQAARDIHTSPGRSALVFGPERSGLDTGDVALARAIVTVPVNPDFGSLNLAQAVVLCAYEWSKASGLVLPEGEEALSPAPQDELEGLIGHLEAMLEPKNYFWPEIRVEVNRRTLRNVLTRPGWNHFEIRTLRGVLSFLEKEPRKRD